MVTKYSFKFEKKKQLLPVVHDYHEKIGHICTDIGPQQHCYMASDSALACTRQLSARARGLHTPIPTNWRRKPSFGHALFTARDDSIALVFCFHKAKSFIVISGYFSWEEYIHSLFKLNY